MSYPFAGRYFDKYKPFFPYELGDYSFKVDLQYGELLFTKKLISFSGKHLPLDLSLKYVQRHVDNGTMFSSYSGFPKGFKTNYHVFLEYDSTNSRYLYEDTDGFQHIFELAVNSSTLYYDTFGSGLMLEIINNGFVIFDEDENYQEFDQYGRLIKIHKNIHKHNSTTYYAEQNISYSSDLRISSITDNYNRTITFSYSSSYITISYNNNVVITLHTSNACLTKISKNIGGNHIKEDIISQTDRVSGVDLPDGGSLDMVYNGNEVESLHVNFGQEFYSFDYSQLYRNVVSVTNPRNITDIYDFNQNQLAIQTKDNNTNLDYLTIKSDILSATIKKTTGSPEITQFLFNSLPSISVNGNITGYSDYITNNNLQAKRMYLFYAEISTNNPVDLEIQLYDYSGNYLADLLFKGYTRTLSFPVGIKPADNNEFRIKYINNSSNSVTITSAKLVPLVGDFEALCSNCNTGGPVFFYGNTPYYLFKQGQVAFINGDYYDNVTNHDPRYQDPFITFDDYLKNEKLFYKRNGTFHFWCKDQKILIDNASRVFNAVGGGGFVAYDASINIVAHYTGLYTVNDIIWFYRIKGDQNNAFSVTKISHNSASFHTGYTSYYEEEETKYVAGNTGYVTYYDYDENYALIESNRDDGYKEKYSYDSHGNLLNKVTSHTDINQQIKYGYEYDSNDNLVSDSKLVGAAFVQTDYDYDNFGNIEEIDYPNGLTQDFYYDGITGEKNTSVAFECNNLSTVQQYDNYIDADTYSLSVSGNTYRFDYSNGTLLNVSYNNQNIVSFTYQSATYQGVLIYTGKTTSYNNNYSFVEEYDAYDRISYIEGIRYYYDDFGRVISFSDNNLGTPYAITSFAYDYYDQKASISIMHTGLSTEFTYDSYRRLISQVYKRDNNNLYNASYIYYTIPNLENIIKQTNLSIGSTSISVIDDMDSFSRLTSKSIAIGSNEPYTQHITYKNGGENDAFTNSFVESVYTETILINPRHPITIIEGDYYTYDNVGNIISIAHKFGVSIMYQTDYVYDAYSRLIRENNQVLNKTIVYEYNDDGNIALKTEYAYTTSQTPSNPIITHSYAYDSTYPNRLTNFDNQLITYDNIGNPLTYRGKALSWTRGILLSSVDDGITLINLEYDGLKQRVRKSINSGSSITNYRYINNQLILEEKDNTTITYLYAHNGVIGFKLSGFDSSLNLNGIYYYEKNIQQDVIAIRNTSNNIVASYKYDACGNHIVCNPNGTAHDITDDTFIGNINPIRYRSYYYDTDLKMYWLTTRYYDSEVGRFISPDHYSYLDYQKLHGLNLYAYSKNNPVMYYDPSGHILETILGALLPFFASAILAKTTVDSTFGIINDVIQLACGNIKPDSKIEGQINNSSCMQTIIGKLGYLAWYKYFYPLTGEDLKSPIKGSIFGAAFEWECHNAASIFYTTKYLFARLKKDDTSTLEKKIKSASNVNFEASIFADTDHPGLGDAMKVSYVAACILFCAPVLLIFDLVAGGGWKR